MAEWIQAGVQHTGLNLSEWVKKGIRIAYPFLDLLVMDGYALSEDDNL